VSGADGTAQELTARIVIGADGPGSTVAKLVNATHYHQAPAQQVTMWGYWGA
jgi:2-polyprenyl-6-methoxyphenol hydroxylase-like FAD-dependent oxidoreductase